MLTSVVSCIKVSPAGAVKDTVGAPVEKLKLTSVAVSRVFVPLSLGRKPRVAISVFAGMGGGVIPIPMRFVSPVSVIALPTWDSRVPFERSSSVLRRGANEAVPGKAVLIDLSAACATASGVAPLPIVKSPVQDPPCGNTILNLRFPPAAFPGPNSIDDWALNLNSCA